MSLNLKLNGREMILPVRSVQLPGLEVLIHLPDHWNLV